MDSAKYIGLDAHKKSISIAVLNAAGKIVMECVIETNATLILQFFRGLCGDLHVTFEEGTSAAWLYDLIQPHVTEVVVCNPRQNALLNHGNKSDRIDARKLAELLRGNQLKSVYHGEHGVRTLKELVRSYLTISKDTARVMTRVKALYRSWAIPCTGKQGLCTRPPCGVAGEDHRTRGAPPRRVLLPTARCAPVLAPAGAARVAQRKPETPGVEAALSDSFDGSDPGGGVDWHRTNPAPFPHQAAVVDLQRLWHRDPQQRRLSLRGRAAPQDEQTDLYSRAQHQP
jgi:hypothetical protein